MGQLIQDFANWLLDVLLWIPRQIWDLLLTSLAGLINSIPVPDFVSNIDGLWATIPGAVWYFLASFEIGYGIAVILSAYFIRWLTRRLPLVG